MIAEGWDRTMGHFLKLVNSRLDRGLIFDKAKKKLGQHTKFSD